MRGSLKQRNRGSWTIIYDAGRTPQGHRRQCRETIHGTRKEAERLLAQRLSTLDSRRVPASRTMTFNELVDAFLRERQTRTAPTTLEAYARRLSMHVQPQIGQFLLTALTAEHIELVLSQIRDHSRTTRSGQRVSAGTLRNILIIIRACLEYAVRNEWTPRNVASLVRMPSGESDREPVLFHVDLLQRLFAAIDGSEIDSAVLFALGTGVRRGELCGLRWGDLDLERGWYTIRRNAVHVKDTVVYRLPKTKRSRRTDAIPSSIRRMLFQHRARQEQQRRTLCLGPINEHTPVFTREDGSPWKPNELSRQFSRLARSAGLCPMRLHDLRHGHASLAFAAGVPMHTISDGLGHSSDGITAKIYVHLLGEAREQKADSVNAILERAGLPRIALISAV